MDLNMITNEIQLIGTTVRNISVDNNIVNVEKESKHSFGLNIHEPYLKQDQNSILAQMTIDFKVEIEQSEREKCTLQMSVEGAFVSKTDMDKEQFERLVAVNGATAIIGIARGKIEAVTANIFNEGKVSIPFVNVINYYQSLLKE